MRVSFLVILLLLAFISYAADFSIGTSPGIVVVGDVSPGETKIVKFSIFSVSDEPLLVYFNSDNSNIDFFGGSYPNYMPKVSEEPTDKWIEFLENPREIDPEVRKAGRGWVDINNVLLHVPEDAEPGYHVVEISPMPTYFGNLDVPVGTSIITTIKIPVIFNVRGDAKRNGVVLDTTLSNVFKRGFSTKTFFQNTGTTTLYARATNRVYDSNNTFLGEFTSSKEYVKPGAVFAFDTAIDNTVPEGVYKIEAKVTYTTGSAEKTSILNVYAPVTGAAVAAPEETPWLWVLLVVIAIIIAAWWYREKRR